MTEPGETMGLFWNTGTPDPVIIREAAQMKRYIDLMTCDSAFQEKAAADPERAAREAGLRISGEDARYYARYPLPEARGLQAAFLEEKKEYRRRIRERAGELRHERFAAWHRRQVGRCDLELGRGTNLELMHLPFALELSSGCSVGCPFCGLGAGRLNRVSRADPETMELFAGLVSGALELLGPGVREAILYSATEPMDTPEYPAFVEKFRELCGKTPVMTTAVPMRNPEKTRQVLAMDPGGEKTIHRFSLLSEEVFRRCTEAFSPEETLYVDFLPRYKESRIGLVRAGRSPDAEGWEDLLTDQGTIACVSGFIVNLADRTVCLTTPCRADSQRPNGETVLGPEPFGNAGEALGIIERICGGMRTVPEDGVPLALQPFLHAGDGESFTLENPGVVRISPEEKGTEVCRILAKGPADQAEICGRLSGPAWGTQLTVFSLFRRGIITHTDGFER